MCYIYLTAIYVAASNASPYMLLCGESNIHMGGLTRSSCRKFSDGKKESLILHDASIKQFTLTRLTSNENHTRPADISRNMHHH